MSGSKARATPATLIRSGTGLGTAGARRFRAAMMERTATRMETMMDDQDLVAAFHLLRMKLTAESMGSVRC